MHTSFLETGREAREHLDYDNNDEEMKICGKSPSLNSWSKHNESYLQYRPTQDIQSSKDRPRQSL